MIVCLNGKFIDARKAKISALDNGFLYGDGIYETMRAYSGRILELELHIKRLAKSVKVIGLRLPWSVKNIKHWASQIARRNKARAARIRITLSRGPNGFNFLTCKNPTLLISFEKIILNQRDYRYGISVVTMKLQRVLPEIKTVGLTHMLVAYRSERSAGEVIMIDEKGFVREGASTNVFVVKKGVLYTPKDKILAGLTRTRVVTLAKKMHFQMKVQNFKIPFLQDADEVFLTNRPREIIPVIQINGKKIGKGVIGPHTRNLIKAYRAYVDEYFS